MSGNVLSAFYILSHFILITVYKVTTLTILMIWMWKLRLRAVKSLAKGHTANKY